MILKPHIRIVFAACFVVFALNRFVLRPWMATNFEPSALLSVAYSLPNFIEAIMGTMLISGILFFLRQRQTNQRFQIADSTIYLTATLMATVYVLTQEFNLHNIGGDNVFDSNDVIASIVGLIFVNLLLNRFGFLARQSTR